MTILPAGSFKTSDYRKAIPDWVKIVCAIRAYKITTDLILDLGSWVRSLRFDHRPPLQDRDYDLDAKDFIPAQNDPDHIEAIPAKTHDERTFGRREGAERTVTTANSDAGRRKHIRDIQTTEARHELKMACKRGDPVAIAKLLHVEKPQRPKRKWPKRPMRKRAA